MNKDWLIEKTEHIRSFKNEYALSEYSWVSRDRRIILLGYLMQDNDCDDPIKDCDGMGKFIDKDEDKSFLEHLGLDANREPMTQRFIDLLVRLAGEFPDSTNIEQYQSKALAMWEEANARGEIGTKYARPVTRLYEGGYREAWSKEKYHEIEAVWIPDESLLEHINSFPENIHKEKGAECFKQALEEYNNWAQGYCYGIVFDTFKRIAVSEYELADHDACWGYVGSKYAEEELLSDFKSRQKTLRIQHRQQREALQPRLESMTKFLT